jgi:ribosome-associated toxin RatA of RatAB toxin-antitoxin module
MISTTKSILIHAPIVKIHEVVLDFEHYPRFFPEVRAIEVLKQTKKSAEVLFGIHLIKTINCILKFDIAPKKITWSLVKGDFMKENRGSWEFESKDGKATEVTYCIEVKPSAWIPSSLIEKHMTSLVPLMLKHLKTRCEHTKH